MNLVQGLGKEEHFQCEDKVCDSGKNFIGSSKGMKKPKRYISNHSKNCSFRATYLMGGSEQFISDNFIISILFEHGRMKRSKPEKCYALNS